MLNWFWKSNLGLKICSKLNHPDYSIEAVSYRPCVDLYCKRCGVFIGVMSEGSIFWNKQIKGLKKLKDKNIIKEIHTL